MKEFEDNQLEYERPNKSLMKREAQAMMELTKKLLELPASSWRTLSLDDDILDALLELKEMKQFGAKKRQMKLVAKLLRFVDTKAAEEAVAEVDTLHAAETVAFHKVELWRERLLNEGSALTRFIIDYPSADGQKLRQLIRNAKKEQDVKKSSKSSKLLFKLLKELIDEAGEG